jgi:hypothetical protein
VWLCDRALDFQKFRPVSDLAPAPIPTVTSKATTVAGLNSEVRVSTPAEQALQNGMPQERAALFDKIAGLASFKRQLAGDAVPFLFAKGIMVALRGFGQKSKSRLLDCKNCVVSPGQLGSIIDQSAVANAGFPQCRPVGGERDSTALVAVAPPTSELVSSLRIGVPLDVPLSGSAGPVAPVTAVDWLLGLNCVPGFVLDPFIKGTSDVSLFPSAHRSYSSNGAMHLLILAAFLKDPVEAGVFALCAVPQMVANANTVDWRSRKVGKKSIKRCRRLVGKLEKAGFLRVWRPIATRFLFDGPSGHFSSGLGAYCGSLKWHDSDEQWAALVEWGDYFSAVLVEFERTACVSDMNAAFSRCEVHRRLPGLELASAQKDKQQHQYTYWRIVRCVVDSWVGGGTVSGRCVRALTTAGGVLAFPLATGSGSVGAVRMVMEVSKGGALTPAAFVAHARAMLAKKHGDAEVGLFNGRISRVLLNADLGMLLCLMRGLWSWWTKNDYGDETKLAGLIAKVHTADVARCISDILAGMGLSKAQISVLVSSGLSFVTPMTLLARLSGPSAAWFDYRHSNLRSPRSKCTNRGSADLLYIGALCVARGVFRNFTQVPALVQAEGREGQLKARVVSSASSLSPARLSLLTQIGTEHAPNEAAVAAKKAASAAKTAASAANEAASAAKKAASAAKTAASAANKAASAAKKAVSASKKAASAAKKVASAAKKAASAANEAACAAKKAASATKTAASAAKKAASAEIEAASAAKKTPVPGYWLIETRDAQKRGCKPRPHRRKRKKKTTKETGQRRRSARIEAKRDLTGDAGSSGTSDTGGTSDASSYATSDADSDEGGSVSEHESDGESTDNQVVSDDDDGGDVPLAANSPGEAEAQLAGCRRVCEAADCAIYLGIRSPVSGDCPIIVLGRRVILSARSDVPVGASHVVEMWNSIEKGVFPHGYLAGKAAELFNTLTMVEIGGVVYLACFAGFNRCVVAMVIALAAVGAGDYDGVFAVVVDAKSQNSIVKD